MIAAMIVACALLALAAARPVSTLAGSRADRTAVTGQAQTLPHFPSLEDLLGDGNGDTSPMLDQPVDQIPSTSDARWSATITGNSAGAVVAWVMMLVVLGAIGSQLIRPLFGRFADQGHGFGRIVLLVSVGYVVWLLASIEVILFRAIWVGFAVLVAGLLAFRSWRNRQPGAGTTPSAASAAEIVFWGVFVFFLLLRLVNPDSWHPYWGGEKPMEFAHLNAILRAGHFPPYDPWYSGGELNYYYFGGYLSAFMIKLTGIPSEIAYNLALPTWLALVASGSFSIGSTLAVRTTRRAGMAVPGGLSAVVMVVIGGNLSAARKVIEGLPALPHPDFVGWTWYGSRVISGAITEFPFFSGLYADMHAHLTAIPIGLLVVACAWAIADLRWPSREATRRVGMGAVGRTTTVLLLGTLSVGALAATNAWDVPVYGAILAGGFWLSLRRCGSWWRRLAIAIPSLAGIAITAYLLFLPFHRNFVALFSKLDTVRSSTTPGELATHLGGLLLVAGIGLVVALWGRARSTPSWAWAIPLAVAIALLWAGTWPHFSGTFSGQVLSTIGIFIPAIVFVFSFTEGSDRQRQLTGMVTAIALAVIAAACVSADRVVAGLLLMFFGGALLLWLGGRTIGHRFTGLLLMGATGVAAGVEFVYVMDDLAGLDDWYRMNTVFKFYNEVWVLLALSAAVLTSIMLGKVRDIREHAGEPGAPTATELPEIVPAAPSIELGAPVADPDGIEVTDASSGESDAIHFAGPESAVAAFEFVPVADASATALQPILDEPRWPRVSLAQVGTVAAAVVVAASLLYPALASGPRLEMRFEGHPGPGTLDALDWMQYGTLTTASGAVIQFRDDRAAIDWLNEHVDGTPVIAEASIGPYRGNGSRISIATGLPTVLGWQRHETQQRSTPELDARWMDIRALYDDPDPAVKRAVIERYGITYIVIGDVERLSLLNDNPADPYASAEGIAALEGMIGTELEVVFQQGSTLILAVPGREPAPKPVEPEPQRSATPEPISVTG